ncbi:MAG: DNA adenine methylase [Opitutaceae bacterium]
MPAATIDPASEVEVTNELRLVSAPPQQTARYPRFRHMGSKHRLLDWLHSVFCNLEFDTVTDAFSGSGSVSYLLKAMGKTVTANDALSFPSVLAHSTIANNTESPR